MTRGEAINWIINLTADIGKVEHQDLWHYEQALEEIRDMIEALPSVQPERIRGRWIKMSDADGDYYVCDQCGEELPRYTTKSPTWDIPYPTKYSIDKTNFCPNCGADMRESR